MEKPWKEELKELIALLGLEKRVVAVAFTNEPVGVKDRKRVSLCRALKQAGEGKSFVIDPENSDCPGGTWHIGLAERASGEQWRSIQRFLTRGEKLTCSIVTFQRMIELTTPPPTGLCERIFMGPVEEAEHRPDLVVFQVNAEQACRLITLDQYWDGIPPRVEMAGSMCHSALAYPVVTGRTNVSLGDWTARRMQKFSPETVFVTIPYERIHDLIAAVPECSAGSAKLEIPDEFQRHLETEGQE